MTHAATSTTATTAVSTNPNGPGTPNPIAITSGSASHLVRDARGHLAPTIQQTPQYPTQIMQHPGTNYSDQLPCCCTRSGKAAARPCRPPRLVGQHAAGGCEAERR